MANIIVYATAGVNKQARRQAGMREAAVRIQVAVNALPASPTAPQLNAAINGPLQSLINSAGAFEVFYKWGAGANDESVLSVKNVSAGTYDYTRSGAARILKIKPVKDKDNPMSTDVMHVAVPTDLTSLGYLGAILGDMGAGNNGDNRNYLLGTIFLRRCR